MLSGDHAKASIRLVWPEQIKSVLGCGRGALDCFVRLTVGGFGLACGGSGGVIVGIAMGREPGETAE